MDYSAKSFAQDFLDFGEDSNLSDKNGFCDLCDVSCVSSSPDESRKISRAYIKIVVFFFSNPNVHRPVMFVFFIMNVF